MKRRTFITFGLAAVAIPIPLTEEERLRGILVDFLGMDSQTFDHILSTSSDFDPSTSKRRYGSPPVSKIFDGAVEWQL